MSPVYLMLHVGIFKCNLNDPKRDGLARDHLSHSLHPFPVSVPSLSLDRRLAKTDTTKTIFPSLPRYLSYLRIDGTFSFTCAIVAMVQDGLTNQRL